MPARGPYGVGSNIVLKATMSENVNVIGTPRIILVLGTTERTAEYTSGTGTKILLFQYTVQTGDADTDGISVKQDSLDTHRSLTGNLYRMAFATRQTTPPTSHMMPWQMQALITLWIPPHQR